MKKINLCVATILLSAVTSSTLLFSVNSTVLAQSNSGNSPQKINLTEKQPSLINPVTGVGIISLVAGFVAVGLFFNRRQKRPKRVESKIDRYQEEFACGPLQQASTAKLSEIQQPKTSTPSLLEVPASNDTISTTNSDTISWRKQYQGLIEQIVETTLKGQIRSKEQVYQILVEKVSIGTGEIFERCLDERLSATQYQLKTQTDELKKAKAGRTQRALQTICGVWEQSQKENQAIKACNAALQQIQTAETKERLAILFEVLDPNQSQVFTLEQIKILATSLKQAATSTTDPNITLELQQLGCGLARGLESLQALEGYQVSWMYEPASGSGFEATPGHRGPWKLWSQKVKSELAQQLFRLQELDISASELAVQQRNADLSAWVELAVILQGLQRGLVSWFDKQPYDAKWGKRSSSATFIIFAIIWCQLSIGFNQAQYLSHDERQQLAKACFQVTLQILRNFAQQDNFPLYGGIFANFGGDYMKDTLKYLDEPLRQVEGTQEKSRIFTLLGYSQRGLGEYEQANSFHQQALEIARDAGDQICEIANLNHLSRTLLAQKNYDTAINYSQRALILARQTGDKLGEANALANMGYGEVLAAQARDEMAPEVYETNIEYLQQGLQLSERLGDFLSSAICYNSLGIAYVVLQQPTIAAEYLEKAVQSAQWSGDFFLQGLNFRYLAEAYYSLNNLDKVVCFGCLAMYIFKQISVKEWRQAAGLLTIVQGQIGVETFQKIIGQQRSYIISVIGVDGFDYLGQLLEQYKTST